MITDFQQLQIDKYLTNNLSTDEMISFEELLKSDVELSNELKYQSEIKEGISNIVLKEKFKLWENEKDQNKLKLSTNYKKTFAIAASILLVIGFSISINYISKSVDSPLAKTKKQNPIKQIKPLETLKSVIVKNTIKEISIEEINKSIIKKELSLEVQKESMGFGESKKEKMTIEQIDLSPKIKLLEKSILQNPSNVKELTVELAKAKKEIDTYDFYKNNLKLYISNTINKIEIYKSIAGYTLSIDNYNYKINRNMNGKLIKRY